MILKGSFQESDKSQEKPLLKWPTKYFCIRRMPQLFDTKTYKVQDLAELHCRPSSVQLLGTFNKPLIWRIAREKGLVYARTDRQTDKHGSYRAGFKRSKEERMHTFIEFGFEGSIADGPSSINHLAKEFLKQTQAANDGTFEEVGASTNTSKSSTMCP